MAKKKKAPVEIVNDFLEGLFADLKSSYRLAMVAADVDKDRIREIEEEVDDYVANNWY